MTTNYDLAIPGMAKIIANDLKATADRNEEDDSPPRHSWRVAPSSLFDDCVAKLWYKFRWAKLERTPGQMLRLFRDGAEAESPFVEILRRMGFEVMDVDPERVAKGAKNPQFRVKDFNGHLSGYLDGIGRHPAFTCNLWALLEFKTFNTKRFAAWVSKGVKISDPKYYGQICLYMKYYNLPFCIMMGKDKNTSEIHFEIIMRDDATADDLLRRAHTVINSRSRPGRLAESPAHHKCKYCPLMGVCHHGEPVDVSCRSCVNCYAIDGGKFACDLYGPIPGETEIKAACGNYSPIR